MARRNTYIGSWRETDFTPIHLPFDITTFQYLLATATLSTNPYTHQQIADWANRFWWECLEGSLTEATDPQVAEVAELAADIDAQWDLFLVNTYSLEELQVLDFSQVVLPEAWFHLWLRKVSYGAS